MAVSKKRVSSPTGESESTAKKPKGAKEPVRPIHAHLPTNTVLPAEIASYARPAPGVSRLCSWNVCGIKASYKKGLIHYLEAEDPDVLFLCETKSVDPNISELSDRFPHRYWGVVGGKKGYAGVAFLSKIEPKSAVIGIDGLEESDGRVITLEFENSFLVGTYTPNAGSKLATLQKKKDWNVAFEAYLGTLNKPIVWMGDINCVQSEKDIRNWKTNYNKTAGCTDDEINGLKSQMEAHHLVDIWRELNPEEIGHYTYFSYMFQCRPKGIGWRLDSFFVTDTLKDRVKQCEIRHEIYGASDHVPIVLDIEGPL